jgi:hypothetical protein
MPRPRKPAKPSALESRVSELAATFAREVIAALRSAQLADIAALAGGLARSVARAPAAPAANGAKPKRRVVNYPKCRWPGCGKNMSPRTRPYCGEHNRRVQEELAADAAAATETTKGKGRTRRAKR